MHMHGRHHRPHLQLSVLQVLELWYSPILQEASQLTLLGPCVLHLAIHGTLRQAACRSLLNDGGLDSSKDVPDLLLNSRLAQATMGMEASALAPGCESFSWQLLAAAQLGASPLELSPAAQIRGSCETLYAGSVKAIEHILPLQGRHRVEGTAGSPKCVCRGLRVSTL